MDKLEYWAKRLTGIPISNENNIQSRITRGESISATVCNSPAFLLSSSRLTHFDAQNRTRAYVEEDPTVSGWIQGVIPTRASSAAYLRNLFPVIQWLPNYNKVWFAGDLIAGVTVGAVVVPQSMAYAKLAGLAPEFGLYSSFVGVLLYFAFATSKDITIGPVAVMSTLTGQIITRVRRTHPHLVPYQIAGVLAVLCGAFVTALGILRLGFIVDFIPLPAIGAFMTGSALNIAISQVPALMGITGLNTRDATYKVFINILKHLGRSDINAAVGLTALFLLYLIRSLCTWRARRDPSRAKLFFFISTLRTAFVILLYTLISWLVNRHRKKHPRFSILSTVPRGFKHMNVPTVNHTTVVALAKELPGAIIVLLIEHIAISKSFGRVNNYTISPSQELIAIGVTNLFGPFFGAYPATGSFSRTAIKSKSGVRTPLAGVITALVVLLSIYALPPVFFYIPNAALSAVIIHAVLDLITPPKSLYHWWKVSPPEIAIFFAGVIGCIFGTIEIGIYTAIASTGGLLLFRIAKSRGDFLGRIEVWTNSKFVTNTSRRVYVPLDHADGSNPGIPVEEPIPGVFVYRPRQSPLYPSVGCYTDQLVAVIQAQTKRTNANSFPTLGDRPWNFVGPRHIDPNAIASDPRPTLKAIVMDFTAVEHVDVTSVQILQDVRSQLDRHASPNAVEWHFAGVSRPWVKRGLVAGGFGRILTPLDVEPLYSIAKLTDASDPNEVRKHLEQENLSSKVILRQMTLK
ncbi:sulfate permease [Cantharellus anzutake]|uniref:sulfate permease n=1 Tax=Cantharellus anzutake TaxID=1750568 RepID=UPI0019071D51|nr:sulfate permease [Cantharellus anzutake]KAF8342606.1 sulfate permease [Cantharellus anzutake]